MRIFLSYASEDKNIADDVYLNLVQHHKVFFDHTRIKGGDDFTLNIRNEIKKCDLFIFLISPDSLARSSYALTELMFAREKWSHPKGHVLPVLIRETNYDSIPPYLKAVSILEPEGNVPVEVANRVDSWKHEHRSYRAVALAVAFITLAIIGVAFIKFVVLRESGYQPGVNDNMKPASPVPGNNSLVVSNAANAPAGKSSKTQSKSETDLPVNESVSSSPIPNTNKTPAKTGGELTVQPITNSVLLTPKKKGSKGDNVKAIVPR